MGLFDGAPGDADRTGSSADVAARSACRWCWCSTSPARRRSAAAIAKGFAPTIRA